MDKIYQKSEDANVIATVIYANMEDEYVYADAECTSKLKTSELKDVFIKGVLLNVQNGAEFTKPSCFFVDEAGKGCITCIMGVDESGNLANIVLTSEPDEAVSE